MSPINHNTAWSDADDERLASLCRLGLTDAEIGQEMGRTSRSIEWRRHRLGLRKHDLDDDGFPGNGNVEDDGLIEAALDCLTDDERLVFEVASQRPQDVDVRKFLKVASALQRMYQVADPIQVHERIHLPAEVKDKPFGVWWVSCAHFGGRYTDNPAFKAVADMVLSLPRMFVGMMGDDTEGMFAGALRSAEAVASNLVHPVLQRRVLNTILSDLHDAGRLLFGMRSQHPSKWQRARIGEDLTKTMYLEMGVPYFDGKAVVEFVPPAANGKSSQTYCALVAHSLKGYSIHNILHAQGRGMRWDLPSAHMIVAADKHQKGYTRSAPYVLEALVGRRETPEVIFLAVGTAKIGLDPYTIEGWQPGSLFWPVTVMWPDQFRIEVSDRLDNVCFWLGEDMPDLPELPTQTLPDLIGAKVA